MLVHQVARDEDIRCGLLIAVGGVRRAKIVVGPKSPTGKIEPSFREFDDARETVGVGTLFWDEAGPVMSLHTALGRGETTLVGCPRGGADAFCILEITIVEITGVGAARVQDAETGFKLLRFLQ